VNLTRVGVVLVVALLVSVGCGRGSQSPPTVVVSESSGMEAFSVDQNGLLQLLPGFPLDH